MEKYVEKLIEATAGMTVAYRLVYDKNGNPGVDVRGAFGRDIKNETIVIDDITWTILGDVVDCVAKQRFNRVHQIDKAFVSYLRVELRAQGTVNDKPITVDLGLRRIDARISAEIYGVDEDGNEQCGLLLTAK